MTMRLLGMIINFKLTMSDHLDHLLASCALSIHALRMLMVHDMRGNQMHAVATIYATPEWWEYTFVYDRDIIDQWLFVKKSICWY